MGFDARKASRSVRRRKTVGGLPMSQLRRIVKDTRPRDGVDEAALERAEAKRERRRARNARLSQ